MLRNYLKVAIKVLMRRKFYTAVNLFGIAFTLLILMLCAAMMDNILAPGTPEVRLARILVIERAQMKGPTNTSSSSPGFRLLDDYARDLPGVELFSVTTNTDQVVSFVDGSKVVSEMRRTDGEFWEIMEFEFVEGGSFTSADEEQGNFVAVINEVTRRRFFDGQPALGQTLRADDQAFTVVGVVRDVPFTRPMSFADIWVPLSTAKSTSYREAMLGGFQGIILADSRDDFPVIKQEFHRRISLAELPNPDVYDTLQSAALTRYEELAMETAGDGGFESEAPVGRFTLLMVLMAVAFMLLPALNLINLSLSRILERSSEIGVRKAFGASSWTLVGQFLVENVVLTMGGGLIGLLLSLAAVRILNQSGLIPYAEFSVSFRVFVAGLGLALLFAMVSGAYPAWRMSRLHPVEALHGRAR